MSYTTPPPPSGAPDSARPGTVSLATTLLYVLGLLAFVNVALGIYTATFFDKAKLVDIYRDAGAPQDIAETSASVASVTAYTGSILAVVFGVVYIILAVFVGKGKQWARITTWVWAGLIGVCCGIAGLAGQAASGMLSGMGGNTGGIDQVKVQEALTGLVPGWVNTATMIIGIISLIAAIAVIVLLALPPSNPFFRKAEPQWTPPTYPAP